MSEDRKPLPMFFGLMDDAMVANKGERYKFKNIQTHVGGGYNTGTGLYTCPETGYYLFSVSIKGRGKLHMEISILLHHLLMCLFLMHINIIIKIDMYDQRCSYVPNITTIHFTVSKVFHSRCIKLF